MTSTAVAPTEQKGFTVNGSAPCGNYSSTPEKCFNFPSKWTGSPTEIITYK